MTRLPSTRASRPHGALEEGDYVSDFGFGAAEIEGQHPEWRQDAFGRLRSTTVTVQAEEHDFAWCADDESHDIPSECLKTHTNLMAVRVPFARNCSWKRETRRSHR
ncbi:hypothetical protein CBM2585_A50052 [Cupriavidus taiwanensis]|nr:hypothetical protein CBM2585_A50052 [Cupriavidus taiwanensis]